MQEPATGDFNIDFLLNRVVAGNPKCSAEAALLVCVLRVGYECSRCTLASSDGVVAGTQWLARVKMCQFKCVNASRVPQHSTDLLQCLCCVIRFEKCCWISVWRSLKCQITLVCCGSGACEAPFQERCLHHAHFFC